MDKKEKRTQLLAEVSLCREQANWHVSEANRLNERAVFLSGAVGLLNEQIKEEDDQAAAARITEQPPQDTEQQKGNGLNPP